MSADFEGFAEICRFFDPTTGQYYETVETKALWNADSGGVYTLRYSYIPYSPGIGIVGERTTHQTVFIVEGDMFRVTETKDTIEEEKNRTRILFA